MSVSQLTSTSTVDEQQSDSRSRWQRLKEKYGLLGAIRPYFFGEQPPTVSEEEPVLPSYIQAMIYATSLATLFVFGSAEIFLILKYGWTAVSAILLIPLGLLLIVVYAMDRSFARTIPRIGLLAQRRQWGLLIEHLLYAFGVGAVEATTYGLVIYTLENNIQALLHGQSIVPPGRAWLIGLLVTRAVLLVWTIVHAYLTSHSLPATWGTIERLLIKRVGGRVIEGVTALNFSQASLGNSMGVLSAMLAPIPPAKTPLWKPRARREEMALLAKAHRDAIVAEITKLSGAAPGEAPVIPPDLLARLEAIATQAAAIPALAQAVTELQLAQERIAASDDLEEESDEAEPLEMQMQVQRRPASRPRSAPPQPGERGFPKWVYAQAKALHAEGIPLTPLTLAERTGHPATVVQEAFNTYRQMREGEIRKGDELRHDPVLMTPNL